MQKNKWGNPKRKSRFICIKCLTENQLGSGIQRLNQRENCHVKSLYCIKCNMITYNLEVRYCDYLPDMIDYAKDIRNDYYTGMEYNNELQISM